MSPALSTYNDFINATGPAYMTSASQVVNDAIKQSPALRRFLRGMDPSFSLQGGQDIRDSILLDEQSTAQTYHPDETFTWSNPQTLAEHQVDWRFIVDHMAWNDQEVLLNGQAEQMTRDARHDMYKRLKYTKEQRMWTSLINFMEGLLWAVPDTTKMEAAGGKDPYSIIAHVNEYTNGLFGNGLPTTVVPTAWTTKENINPATEAKWRPQQVAYTETGVGTGANNILAAFDQMFYDVKYDAPGTKEEYFENDAMFGQVVWASTGGCTTYQRLLRDSQDLFASQSRQDPAFVNPQYAGIDVLRATDLDTAALYSNNQGTPGSATALGAEVGNGASAGNGPRYYWTNSKYLTHVFHTSRYMYKHEVMRHPNQPFTWVCPVDCWSNLVARSLSRLGVIFPTGNLYTSAYDPV